VIAETATLERVDGMHTMIHALCGTHGIFRISQKPFHVIKIETGITPPDERNSHGGIDWDKMMKYFNQHPIRNQLILSIIQQNKSHKILLLTGYKEQAKILLEALRQQGESVDYMIGTKKTYSDSRILIGTISKIGTGFDEESACANFNGIRLDLLILCTSIKNAARLEQSVGRVFRAEFPTFIDLVDNHAICKNHWYERRKWYLDPRRNGTIAEQKLDLQTLAIQPKPTKKEKNQKGEKEETVPQTMILARQQVQRLRQQAGSSIPLPHLLSSSSSSI
jgi:superfamily II DNA or RNA helicase